MYNHAAYVNHERAERRYDTNKGEDRGKRASSSKDPVVAGKPISKLNDDELDRYFRGFGSAFSDSSVH
jgi:hypothetical protein